VLRRIQRLARNPNADGARTFHNQVNPRRVARRRSNGLIAMLQHRSSHQPVGWAGAGRSARIRSAPAPAGCNNGQVPLRESLSAGAVVAERYQIIEPLARGGYGAVYVAEQLATERRVALKVLWPHVLENARAREQFTLEARVAGRINSENVVQVLDAGVDTRSDITYLVMELLEGRDLAKLVEESGSPTPSEALEYLRQTAAGLEKAHRYVDRSGRPAPIIHRDLKPDNLFLTRREDGSPLIKILDFGIAKVLSQSTQMSGEVKGTPLFMAFEQASRGPISPATDVWAFGLIAFYLFTGKNYWMSGNSPDGSMTQLFGEVLSLPFTPPSLRATEIEAHWAFNPAFDAWFARCVHRDARQRYQSITEAMRGLSEIDVGGARSLVPSSALRQAASVPGLALPALDSPSSASAEAVTLQGARTLPALQRTLPASEHDRLTSTGKRRRGAVLGLGGLGLSCVIAAAMLWRQSRSDATVDKSSIVLTQDSSRPVRAPMLSAAKGSAAAVASAVPSAVPAASATIASPPSSALKSREAPRILRFAPKAHPGKKDDVYGDR
jgi:eukaryotic-like serine/threonine-protein kinase